MKQSRTLALESPASQLYQLELLWHDCSIISFPVKPPRLMPGWIPTGFEERHRSMPRAMLGHKRIVEEPVATRVRMGIE